jgi:hypothetical protein
MSWRYLLLLWPPTTAAATPAAPSLLLLLALVRGIGTTQLARLAAMTTAALANLETRPLLIHNGNALAAAAATAIVFARPISRVAASTLLFRQLLMLIDFKLWRRLRHRLKD